MSKEKLSSTLDELESIFKNISQNGLQQIAKMQNLSQNELMKITKMQNLSQNELEQIASIAELCKSKSDDAEIEKAKKKFNALRNNFSKEKIKEMRKKFYEREKIDKYFKEL